MRNILLLSALLSVSLMAAEAPQNMPEAPKKIQTVDPIVVTPVVVQPLVINQSGKVEEKSECDTMQPPKKQTKSSNYETIRINVVGQGVAPTNTSSPAQAYALAKRAAIADAYRLLAEKVKGVRIEGEDKIKNMMVQRSEVRTYVDAVIAEAQIIETVFKDGLCEVEMELTVSPEQWRSILASR
jgi:hypothetical protein